MPNTVHSPNLPSTPELNPNFFQQIPNTLFNDVAYGLLEPLDIHVYAVIRSLLGTNEYVWPKLGTIGDYIRRGESEVESALERLALALHIKRHGQRIYFL